MSAQRERWRVVEARFELSAPRLKDCPVPDLPELAVAGRSNVGKSSLLNRLSGQRGLARVSRTPGRTQLLNFFTLQLMGAGEKLPLRLVDLPGYGFAKAARAVRDSFAPMIESYLAERSALRGILVLIDSRHGPKGSDIDLLEYCAERGIPCIVCATKADKLSASERGVVSKKIAKALGVDARDVLLTSAQSGQGLDASLGGPNLPNRIAGLTRGEVEIDRRGTTGADEGA